MPPLVESRKTTRKRVILGGKVVYNEGSYTTDCRIRDISDAGARIVLAPGIVIPTRVVLVDTRSAIAYESEVIWLRPPDFGLRFLATYSLRGVVPPHLHYLKRY
jgi:hypothetical protein